MIRKILRRIRLMSAPMPHRIDIFRSLGVRIGKDCRIVGRIDFGSEPYLVSIGDGVIISSDVVILTHDGAVGLFRKDHPGMNVYAPVHVGNRVFIGNRVMLMPGVTVGDDVVIGAGSLVTKSVPSGSVVAGVPARVLGSIQSYKDRSLLRADFVDSSDPSKLQAHLRRTHPDWFGQTRETNSVMTDARPADPAISGVPSLPGPASTGSARERPL